MRSRTPRFKAKMKSLGGLRGLISRLLRYTTSRRFSFLSARHDGGMFHGSPPLASSRRRIGPSIDVHYHFSLLIHRTANFRTYLPGLAASSLLRRQRTVIPLSYHLCRQNNFTRCLLVPRSTDNALRDIEADLGPGSLPSRIPLLTSTSLRLTSVSAAGRIPTVSPSGSVVPARGRRSRIYLKPDAISATGQIYLQDSLTCRPVMKC